MQLVEATECGETQKDEEERREPQRLRTDESEKDETEEEQHKRHVQESEDETNQRAARRVQGAAEEANVTFEQITASKVRQGRAGKDAGDQG